MAFENTRMHTKSALLERGWTPKTIKALLSLPIQKENLHYQKNSMMPWDTDVATEAELAEEFPAAKAAKDHRRIIAAKAVKTKTARTEAVTDDNISRIHVGAVDPETLEKLTLRSAINLANAKGD